MTRNTAYTSFRPSTIALANTDDAEHFISSIHNTARTILHTADHGLQAQLHTHLIHLPKTQIKYVTVGTAEKIHNAAETICGTTHPWSNPRADARYLICE
jgi:hypothetical protein